MFEPVRWIGGENAKEPPSTFRRYTEINLKRGLPEISLQASHNIPLYIVCSGASLAETWEELRDAEGDIWALNAAFDWLKNKGIRPDWGVSLAPENAILNYFETMGGLDKFLFASQTHPDLVERAVSRGAGVQLWHTKHPDEWDMPERKGPLIYGGGTVGSRSIDLAYALGYREVHILGMDASCSYDGMFSVDRPICDDLRKVVHTYFINGRPFIATPSHARQVEDFAAVLKPLTGMNVTLYGDGMLQWSQRRTDEH